jgi:hypothetical protein
MDCKYVRLFLNLGLVTNINTMAAILIWFSLKNKKKSPKMLPFKLLKF